MDFLRSYTKPFDPSPILILTFGSGRSDPLIKERELNFPPY
jgi:hypothetical protein